MDEQKPIQSRQINAIIGLLISLVVVAIISLARNWNDQLSTVRWEYRVEAIKDTTLYEDLHALGADGWEMVSARRAMTSPGSAEGVYEMIFRRPAGRTIKGP